MRRSALIVILMMTAVTALSQQDEIMIHDDFADVKNWEPLLFPKIPDHSSYSIVKEGTNSLLKAETDASASGLILKRSFSVREYPGVSWRWKTDRVFNKGNAASKDGDDYPVRVYIIFEYDPAKASFGLRAKYGLAKKLYGEYPPHSSLNYIWANRRHDKDIIVSPYTARSVMIPLQAGTDNLGKWITEEINILSDYRRAFGAEPPDTASLAIMSDSDNTGESAISFIDFIKVFR
jgi:hypothetical protein